MDRRQQPPPPLEESVHELTLEDGRPRPDPDPPTYRSPDEATMDLDSGDGGAAETRRHQHGTVVLPRQYLGGNILPAVPTVAAPPVGAAVAGAVGDEHMEEARRGFPPPPPPPWQQNAPPRRVRDVEEILLEMLPEGSVLVWYTVNGYLFA